MAKRSTLGRTEFGERGCDDDDPVRARLHRHLEFLGLTRTRDEFDERLAWAARERPGNIALFKHRASASMSPKPRTSLFDIWIASRVSTALPFSNPHIELNLSSDAYDQPGWISPDGCTFYLASDRDLDIGDSDLWVARRPL